MAEIIPYLLYVIVPIPLPLTPTQILAIDLGFEMLLTLAFAWEPCEDTNLMMSMPPRKQVTLETSRERFTKAAAGVNETGSQEIINSAQIMAVDESTDLLHEQKNIQEDLKVLNTRLQSRYTKYIKEATQVTNQRYWKEHLKEMQKITSKPSGQSLLDSEVLLWSYIEAGLIEVAGCLTTYFAIFWFQFGVSAEDARRGQIKGNYYWKPHSPDLPLHDGSVLVFYDN